MLRDEMPVEGERRGANKGLVAMHTVPPVAIEIAGQLNRGSRVASARKRRGAITPPATRMRVPPVAPIPEIGGGDAAPGGEGHTTAGNHTDGALA